MGGHSAWRKRLAAGELAKQSGGAICRHRPHLGRKGKDREVERKGNINGGPRKKKRNKARIDADNKKRRADSLPSSSSSSSSSSLASDPNKKAGGTFVTLALQAFAVVLVLSFLISLLVTGRSSMSKSTAT